jgi:putative CocE/NonD family hydrolase
MSATKSDGSARERLLVAPMRWPGLLLALAACGVQQSPPVARPLTAAAPSPQADTTITTAPSETLDAADLDAPDLAAQMGRLARATVPRLASADTENGLVDRALLELAAGDPAAALAALARARTVARPADPTRRPVLYTGYEIAARAELVPRVRGGSFDDAFRLTFREVYARLDDLSALHASGFLPDARQLAAARNDLQATLDRLRGRRLPELGLDDAIELVRRFAIAVFDRAVLPLASPLQAEDDARRYDVQDDARITTRDGATLSAVVVRPRRLAGPQPTALFFGIYTGGFERQAFVSAAHGYVGVAAFTRGKRLGTGPVVPYEHEASDTVDAIDWIHRQPWSDGRVGMYGGSYCGFTQWAAAKHRHPALKTIVPYVAAIPGQGLPMENNVFLNANYGWAFYVGDGPFDDDRVYDDRARWGSLADKWFASGRPYREIDRVDGTPNPLLQRWLAHPAYDAYWQAMVPYGADFAAIDIPVLTVTGYYDDGQISALRYFIEHTRHRKDAQHYLLIGPYDHRGAQRRPPPVLRGYPLDPVALIDTTAITFEWFDHVLRGGPMPAILADRVNYEVMGANVWRHAPTIDRMHDEVLTLYLDDHRLSPRKPSPPGFVAQEVDLADRKTQTNEYYPDPIVHDRLDDGHGVVFESEPLTEPLSIDGTFAGALRMRINKKDVDVGVELYERTPDEKYVSLSYYLGRASYARDMSVRHLLTPGAIETVPFERTRMVSRQLSKGSRIVVVVNVNKNAFAQVDMGTGKDVSDESIVDAGEPLRVQWYGDSVVRIPVHR